MRTYGQYCPIARAAELVAERWTPLIIRNIHAGCGTYGEILAGAPGLSHTLLTQRLRHLTKVGIISVRPKARGSGVRYALTDAGRDLWPALSALGAWGEQWIELRDEHTNPRFLLWTWSTTYLAHTNLPDRRVVVRFELADRPVAERTIWLVVSPTDAEVCTKRPGLRRRPRRRDQRDDPRPVAHQADRMGRRHPLGQDPRYRSSDTRDGAANLEPTSLLTVKARRRRPSSTDRHPRRRGRAAWADGGRASWPHRDAERRSSEPRLGVVLSARILGRVRRRPGPPRRPESP